MCMDKICLNQVYFLFKVRIICLSFLVRGGGLFFSFFAFLGLDL